MILGYARVSTEGQSLEAQLDVLRASGIERTSSKKISGTKRARPRLDRMIGRLLDGDMVLVAKYDRLSRSLQDLLAIVEATRAKSGSGRWLRTSIPVSPQDASCSTSSHRLPSSSASHLRAHAGGAGDGPQGRPGGRPPALTTERRAEVRRMRDQERRGIAELVRLFEVSPNTVRRARGEVPKTYANACGRSRRCGAARTARGACPPRSEYSRRQVRYAPSRAGRHGRAVRPARRRRSSGAARWRGRDRRYSIASPRP